MFDDLVIKDIFEFEMSRLRERSRKCWME